MTRGLFLALLFAVGGCGSPLRSGTPPVATAPIRFRECAAEAGIDFRQERPGPRPLEIRQMIGPGGALVDLDGDGALDLLLVGEPRCAIYRNLGDGRFARWPIAEAALPPGRWMGCAAADYDGDGRLDLLLTGWGDLRLYRNQGDGRLADVTAAAGLRSGPRDWWTSADWADVDRDGDLDLYVARYVTVGPADPLRCFAGLDPHGERMMGTCGPEVYDAQRGVLFLQETRGRFRDVTAARGLVASHGKSLGAAFADYNGDGWPDLYVANDRMPGDLFLNEGGRRFRNVGVETGTAYAVDGNRQAGMGVDWADVDGDGRFDLCVTTFSQEPKSLYLNGGDTFREASAEWGMAAALPYVAWGVRWFDADHDGRLDLIIANGHAQDGLEAVDPAQPYRQPTLFFHQRDGQLHALGTAAGSALGAPILGRGVAVGDVDGDGRLDVLVTNGDGAPLLLHNETEPVGHWLGVRLRGPAPNRDGIGAVVTCVLPDGARQRRWITTGGSYLSAQAPIAHFGLGRHAGGVAIRVRWPDGREGTTRPEGVDRVITLSPPGALR